MITVKISFPGWWNDASGENVFLKELPRSDGVWEVFQFEINNEVEVCDYWFVYDDINEYLVEKAFCPKENCIFITGEVNPWWQYPTEFLRQFGGIITARDDLDHTRIFKEQHICVWHVMKGYSFLNGLKPFPKTKMLSAIISSASNREGHKKRFAFMNKMKSNFGKDLDWFGKGVNPIRDKWDGLKDYNYSIAIENSSRPDYFTEKIMDCFLAYTMPFYYGCTNIGQYFPPGSYVWVDPKEMGQAVKRIEEAIASKLYERNFDLILEARGRILQRLSFFPYLMNWMRRYPERANLPKKRKLVRGRHYFKGNLTLK